MQINQQPPTWDDTLIASRVVPTTDTEQYLAYHIVRDNLECMSAQLTILNDIAHTAHIERGGDWRDGVYYTHLMIQPKQMQMGHLLDDPMIPMRAWLHIDAYHNPPVAVWWELAASEYTMGQNQYNYYPYRPVLSAPQP